MGAVTAQDNLDNCLKNATDAGTVQSCAERYSAEYQRKSIIIDESPPADDPAPKRDPAQGADRSRCDQEVAAATMQCQDKWNKYYQAVRAGWQSALEKAGEENRQLGANLETANTNKQLLETSLSSIQAERDRLQRELAEAASRPAAELKKTGEENRKLVADLETANKGMQLLKASLGRAEAERDRLQAALTKTAPRPGAEQLAAFPAGQASEGLVLLGIFVLTAGFFIGRRGHQAQWAKLAYGTVAAMISLGIYLGIVYLLPDTRPTDLLLALAGGLLFASLGALLHVRLSPFPRQGQEPGRRHWDFPIHRAHKIRSR